MNDKQHTPGLRLGQCDVYLGEAGVHKQIQETAKELVAHEYGEVQVA